MTVSEESNSCVHDENSVSDLYIDSDDEWGDSVVHFEHSCNSLAEQRVQSKHEFTATDAKIVYFEKFLSEDFLNVICSETNKHAHQNGREN